MLKTGQQEKLYPPTDVSVSQQFRPQLLSVKLEDLVHSIFRNENSSMKSNASYFGVLHWQQWQLPASAPEVIANNIMNFAHCLDSKKFIRIPLRKTCITPSLIDHKLTTDHKPVSRCWCFSHILSVPHSLATTFYFDIYFDYIGHKIFSTRI